MGKHSQCVDCGKDITLGAKRCRSCAGKQMSVSMTRSWRDPYHRRNKLEGLARNQRRRTSNLERAIKALLDDYFDGVIYQYVPDENDDDARIYDFYIPSTDTLVEVDSDYWHSSDYDQKRDKEKEAWALKHNYNFVRIKESDARNLKYMRNLLKELIAKETLVN